MTKFEDIWEKLIVSASLAGIIIAFFSICVGLVSQEVIILQLQENYDKIIINVTGGYTSSYDRWHYIIIDENCRKYSLHKHTVQIHEDNISWAQFKTGLEKGKEYYIIINKDNNIYIGYEQPMPEIIKYRKLN